MASAWVGVTTLALYAGQRSAPHGLFECSSDMLPGPPLLLITIASPRVPFPARQAHISSRARVQTPALSAGLGRDRDTNVRERDGSGTHAGGSGTGVGELLAGTGGSGMV